jgi:hypothetical protein
MLETWEKLIFKGVTDLGRLEWIVSRELDIQIEDTALWGT